MLTYIIGDLFQSPAQVLVNTVNTVGVMGKGIAKKFKTIYPEMFEEYRQLCEAKKLTIGKVWLYKTPNKWILNFPTKTTWRKPSEVEYIEAGLKAFVNGYAERGITSIAFPALGCGNGELDFATTVRPLMERYLRKLPIDIFIYMYRQVNQLPEHKNIKSISKWLRSEAESMSFHEVWLDLEKLIGKGLRLTTFYKEKSFSVRILKNEKGVVVSSDDNEFRVLEEELLMLWNAIRSNGFIFPAVIPPMVASYQDYLLPIFSQLPYCREIIASKNYDTLGETNSRGIQFLPRSTPSSPLFSPSFQFSFAQ